jgi:hypothetical protein
MHNENHKELERITRKSQQALAVSRAHCYGWADLQGCEVEALIDLSCELNDDVTAYLLELDARGNGEQAPREEAR